MYMMWLLSWQRPVSIIIYHGLYIIHIRYVVSCCICYVDTYIVT